jgi:hypothetical protein
MKCPINTGLPYEILIQQIFQDISDTAAVRTIKVQHDVNLQGIILTHQIDVYWEFEVVGVVYKTVLQAKDWNKPVDQGELLKFKGVLDDLPGQPNGVMVTRNGYQSGAAEFARAHGIQLLELIEWGSASRRGVTITTLGYAHMEVLGSVEPYTGKPLGLVLRATPFEPKIDSAIIEVDPEWLKELAPDVAAALIGKRLNYASAAGCSFYDESRDVVGDLHDLYKETVDGMRKEGTKVRKLSHRFSTPTFVATGAPIAPYLKINGLSANISIEAGEPVDSPFELPNIVSFILRNLSTGTTRLIQRKK